MADGSSHLPAEWIEQFEQIVEHQTGTSYDSVSLSQLATAIALLLDSSLHLWRHIEALERRAPKR